MARLLPDAALVLALSGPALAQEPGVVDYDPELPPTAAWPVFADVTDQIGTPGTVFADIGAGRGGTWADVVGPDPASPFDPTKVGPPDGLFDLVQVNSNSPALPLGAPPGQWITPPVGSVNARSIVFRGNPDGSLTDVTLAMTPHDPQGWNVAYPGGSPWGALSADYDDDGDVDLFYPCGGFNISSASTLLRNEGDGTFRNVTSDAGLGVVQQTFGALWLDYDRDGDLDLYELNSGVELGGYYVGDTDQDPSDRLYENLGDGTFVDVAPEAGTDLKSNGFSGVTADLDRDGWTDVVVSCFFQYNKVFYNNGDKTFAFMLPSSSTSFPSITLDVLAPDPAWPGTEDFPYVPEGADAIVPLLGCRSLPAAVVDVNGDGWLDVIFASYSGQLADGNPLSAEGALFTPGERAHMYLSRGDQDGDGLGDGLYREVAAEVGFAHIGGAMGMTAGDFNGDGLPDLYVGGGGPQLAEDLEEDYLYVNEPTGWPPSFQADPDQPLARSFYELGALVGTYANIEMSHGLVPMARDGRLDVAVGNGGPDLFDAGQSNRYFENTGNAGDSTYRLLGVDLVDTLSAPGALGARVEVVRDVPPGPGQVLARERRSGFGFACSSDAPLDFGIGRSGLLFVGVRWPSGARQGELLWGVDPPPVDLSFTETTLSLGIDGRYPTDGGLELLALVEQLGPGAVQGSLVLRKLVPDPAAGGYVEEGPPSVITDVVVQPGHPLTFSTTLTGSATGMFLLELVKPGTGAVLNAAAFWHDAALEHSADAEASAGPPPFDLDWSPERSAAPRPSVAVRARLAAAVSRFEIAEPRVPLRWSVVELAEGDSFPLPSGDVLRGTAEGIELERVGRHLPVLDFQGGNPVLDVGRPSTCCDHDAPPVEGRLLRFPDAGAFEVDGVVYSSAGVRRR